MIPYSILCGKLIWEDHSFVEIRILDFSENGFTFRLTKKYDKISQICRMDLAFFQYNKGEYQKLSVFDFDLQKVEEAEFYRVYSAEIKESEYAFLAKQLEKEYLNYVELKTAGQDAVLSEQLTGYPAKEEAQIAQSMQEWKTKMLKHVRDQYENNEKITENKMTDLFSETELMLSLDSRKLWNCFLEVPFDSFQKIYWEQQGLSWHPLSKKKAAGVYIGNQYCFWLFPEIEQLILLLHHALEQGIIPVLAFSPIQERVWGKRKEIVERLDTWVKQNREILPREKLELVVNDWGMAEYISRHFSESFSLTLGVLLNKRKKDTRLVYKNGRKIQMEMLRENSENASFFQEFLKKQYAIESYSYETCGYLFLPAAGKHVLHMPLYQMNTSGHCTLYAACRYGDRGKQRSEESCPQYCEEYVFLYPTMLSMIGYQNSLFGFDDRSLWDISYLQQLPWKGIQRVVWSFPE